MMHPDTYLRARRDARFHAQVEVTCVEPPVSYPGEAHVEAEVKLVFRRGDELATGDLVTFKVSVIEHGSQMVTDGTWWVLADRVAAGRLLEVFLTGTPPDCALALGQAVPIERPSADPQARLDRLW